MRAAIAAAPRPPTMLLAMRSPRVTVCAGLLAAGACDPQATTDYAGETMARVGGVMSSGVGDVPEGLLPMIMWEGVGVGTLIDVDIAFPARFQIEFRQPPEEGAMIDLPAGSDRPGEVRLAIGGIELLPFGVTEDGRYPIGLAQHHLIVYAEGDMAAGTLGAELIGAALPSGYHVVKVIPAEHPSCPGDHDCLRYSSLDLETSIEVRVDWTENLDRPDLGLDGGLAAEVPP